METKKLINGGKNIDFRNTLELNLDSIKNKNLNKFMPTVRLKDITLIMPNGTLIRENDKFLELHRSWFQDNVWSLN